MDDDFEPSDDPDEFLRRCTKINPHDLNREYMEMPAQLAFWNARAAEAYEEAAISKVEYEREWARAFLEARETGEGKRGQAPIDECRAKADLSDEVHDAHIVYVKAEAGRQKLRGIVETLLAKRDMLQSLGAKLRQEMAADPLVREALADSTARDLNEQ